MGYHTPTSERIFMFYSNGSPNDSTIYLMNNIGLHTTSTAYAETAILRTGVIRKAYIHVHNQTQDCTAEDTSFYVRVNNATDYLLFTGSMANAIYPQTVNNLSIPVAADDYIHVKIVTPAWVTNPTGQYVQVTLELSY